MQYYEHTGTSTAHLTWQTSTPAGQAPSILSFTASPSTVTPGQSATLSWSVNGATSISVNNGVGDVSKLVSVTISPGQTTTYTLTATNSAGSVTSQVAVTVGALPDTQPPTVPILISATANSSTEVDLNWSASNDNVGVTGYQILRNGAVLASVGGSILTYADHGAAPSTTYTYAIKAYDAAGNYSSASNSIPVTTQAATGGTSNCPAPASDAFTGCYYNNVTLTGNPVFTRTDSQINFDWQNGSPAPPVTAGNYSVRWQGYFNFSTDFYRFTLTSSDGMRVYLDGNLIVNAWRDQPASGFQAWQNISQGMHLVTVEYYEDTGWSTAHLTWQVN